MIMHERHFQFIKRWIIGTPLCHRQLFEIAEAERQSDMLETPWEASHLEFSLNTKIAVIEVTHGDSKSVASRHKSEIFSRVPTCQNILLEFYPKKYFSLCHFSLTLSYSVNSEGNDSHTLHPLTLITAKNWKMGLSAHILRRSLCVCHAVSW